MSRVAPHVHTDAAQIARLETIAQRLSQDSRVAITCKDGRVVHGIVSATPSMQVFFDPQGREGLNAVVQIEVGVGGGDVQSVWLDHIREVATLPNPSPPEPSRAQPADPNAPAIDRHGTAGD